MATSTLSAAPTILESPEAAPPFSLLDIRRRITVDEYHRMIESGILGEEPRVELLEGVIVNKMTLKPPHMQATDAILYLLVRLLPPDDYFVTMGIAVAIEERDSEPEPDATVLRGRRRDYSGRRRTHADAAMVVEVSDTSYNEDRSVKWKLYAASSVPVFWILDVRRNRLEIHSEPTGKGESASYAMEKILGPDDEVPLVLDGREIARFPLREILP